MTDRFEEAVASVIATESGSTSRLQRCLKIGYYEASGYMERMQAQGFVSPPNLVGRREVLISMASDHAPHSGASGSA